MVQKFRTYQRVRSNKTGYVRFSAVGSKAEDRYVLAEEVTKTFPKVGQLAKFQRYTNRDLTMYDLLDNGKRVFSWVKP